MSCGNIFNDSVNFPTSFNNGGAGSGTVTSVDLTVPSALFTSPVSGSPVTTSGTLALSLASQSPNQVFASPDGLVGTPTFRSLLLVDVNDFPAQLGNNGKYLTTDGSVPSWVPVPSGVAGSNTQIQFNDGGSLAGAKLLWEKTTSQLHLTDSVSGVGTILSIRGSAAQSGVANLDGGEIDIKSGDSTGNGKSTIEFWVASANQGAGSTSRASNQIASILAYTNTENLGIFAIGNPGSYTADPTNVVATMNMIYFEGRMPAGVIMDRSNTLVKAGDLTLKAAGSTTGVSDAPGGNVIISSGETTGNVGTIVSIRTTQRGQGSASTDRIPLDTVRILSGTSTAQAAILAFDVDSYYSVPPTSYTPSQGNAIYAPGSKILYLGQDRSSTSSSGDLIIQGSGALSGATNKNAGTVTFKTGTSTGDGGGRFDWYCSAYGNGSGTTDRAPTYAQMTLTANQSNIGGILTIGNQSSANPVLTALPTGKFASLVGVNFGYNALITTYISTATGGFGINIEGGEISTAATNAPGGRITIKGGISTGSQGSYVDIYVATRNIGSGTTQRPTLKTATFARYYTGSKSIGILGIGQDSDFVTTPSAKSANGNTIYFPGTAFAAIEMDRNSASIGQGLILTSGSCVGGGSNQGAGALNLYTGKSTGTGTAYITMGLPYNASPATTTDNTAADCAFWFRPNNGTQNIVYTLGDETPTAANFTASLGNVIHFSRAFDGILSLGQMSGTPGDAASKNFYILPTKLTGTNGNGSRIILGNGFGSATSHTTGSGFRETRIMRESRQGSGTGANDTLLAFLVPSQVNLANNTTTSIFEVALPTLATAGGQIDWQVTATDGTNMVVQSGHCLFGVINKAASYSSIFTNTDVVHIESDVSKTIAVTFSGLSGTNKVTIQVNVTGTNITPNVIKLYYTMSYGSSQDVTQL